eukprot:c6974_g1_i1.p1 GENE.c6974_g1_i1~~c6974_g1_i1.p1  ORF type:complete len:399 (+),score=113.33 c6974_g1_i1:33-1199(+)
MLRRCVPNNHECLFTAIGFLAENSSSPTTASRLREICSNTIRSDPDRFNEIVLGMPNEQYAQWITNPFNWGGETEIVVLSEHFKLEISVVTRDTGVVLSYGQQLPTKNGRIYLLYTGQHYDPLVGDDGAQGHPRVFTTHDALEIRDAQAQAVAAQARLDEQARARQRIRKMIKCGGCGAVVESSEAFQTHCSTVDHDDDFAYDCEEVTVVEEMDDQQHVTGGLDPSSDHVVSVYNTHAHPLSNLYPAEILINEATYPSVEHFVLASLVSHLYPEIAKQIRCAKSTEEAQQLFHSVDLASHDDACSSSTTADNNNDRANLVLRGLRVKFTCNDTCASALRATGNKQIALIDGSDMWSGMAVADGIARGKNVVGVLLEQVRQELFPSQTP